MIFYSLINLLETQMFSLSSAVYLASKLNWGRAREGQSGRPSLSVPKCQPSGQDLSPGDHGGIPTSGTSTSGNHREQGTDLWRPAPACAPLVLCSLSPGACPHTDGGNQDTCPRPDEV